MLLTGYVLYGVYLISKLNIYSVLIGFSDYDLLREQASQSLGYFAYAYSKGIALFLSIYLYLIFRRSAMRGLILAIGILVAFVTLQKSVPAYYAIAYVLVLATSSRGVDLRRVSDRGVVAAAAAGLGVATLMSYFAYDAAFGDVVLSIARRVALLPHALDYDAILMVDLQYKHELSMLMATFPTVEQYVFHSQHYYMGSLLEDFTFASGAPNATANSYYITALYLDLRYASVPVSFMLAALFAVVDRWYDNRAALSDPLTNAAYVAAVLGGAKVSSSHLGTVFVSEGLLFIAIGFVLINAGKRAERLAFRHTSRMRNGSDPIQ